METHDNVKIKKIINTNECICTIANMKPLCYTTFWQEMYTNSVHPTLRNPLSNVVTLERIVELYTNAWYKKKDFYDSFQTSG